MGEHPQVTGHSMALLLSSSDALPNALAVGSTARDHLILASKLPGSWAEARQQRTQIALSEGP